MNNKYILKEISKANKLSIKIFNCLKELNINNKLNKTIYYITEINEILTNIEIELEEQINE